MKPTRFLLLLVSSGFIAACNRAPAPQSKADHSLAPDVLAKVGGHSIRLDDFNLELKSRFPEGDVSPGTVECKSLLNQMVDSEALYLQAKAAGFDQKPEIARQIRNLIVSRFLESKLKDANASPHISAEEIANFYETHPGQFAMPAQVRFAVIELRFSPKATDEKKAEVVRRANRILSQARTLPASETGFGLLAERYSEDQATRYARGDAGWVSRGTVSRWAPDLLNAAFGLNEPGDMAPVITTSNACCLVKLIGKKPAGRRPLNDVEDAIRYQLAQTGRHQSQQQLMDSMKTGLKIEINQPLLESISRPTMRTESKPPQIPEG